MSDNPYAFRPIPPPNEENQAKLKKLAGMGLGCAPDVFRDCFTWAILVCQFHQSSAPDFEEHYAEVCERYQMALGEVLDNVIANSAAIRLQMPNNTNNQRPGMN